MFTIGQWRNFEDLEECLTLDELVETYIGLRESDNRIIEGMARMWGVEMQSGGIDQQEEDEIRDIVSSPVQDSSGEQFGVGFGLGHMEIG